MEFPQKTTSQFNEAAFQISRLHNIWNECRVLRERGNLLRWKFKLDGAAIELKYDAKKLDDQRGTHYEEQIKDLDQKIIQTERHMILKPDKHFYSKQFYEFLKEKEELLRYVQEEAGKGGKYSDEDDEGM